MQSNDLGIQNAWFHSSRKTSDCCTKQSKNQSRHRSSSKTNPSRPLAIRPLLWDNQSVNLPKTALVFAIPDLAMPAESLHVISTLPKKKVVELPTSVRPQAR
jgi:hypothetical protein